MGGRREVSILPHSPVTSSDLKQEGWFFGESVSTLLQLVVVATKVKTSASEKKSDPEHVCHFLHKTCNHQLQPGSF